MDGHFLGALIYACQVGPSGAEGGEGQKPLEVEGDV